MASSREFLSNPTRYINRWNPVEETKCTHGERTLISTNTVLYTGPPKRPMLQHHRTQREDHNYGATRFDRSIDSFRTNTCVFYLMRPPIYTKLVWLGLYGSISPKLPNW